MSYEKVTQEKVISSTIQYSNASNSDRIFDIAADVSIQNYEPIGYSNGILRQRDADPMSSKIASFSSDGKMWLNISLSNFNKEESVVVLEAVYAFMDGVKASVEKP